MLYFDGADSRNGVLDEILTTAFDSPRGVSIAYKYLLLAIFKDASCNSSSTRYRVDKIDKRSTLPLMDKTLILTDSASPNSADNVLNDRTADPTLEPKFVVASTNRSPLRYPGGKSRAVSAILSLMPDDTESLCAPFLGGGSVELACAARGIEVFGSDLFEPLVNFWNRLLEDPDALADEVEGYLPLEKDRFYELQKSYGSLTLPLERAAVFFVLNRASYSGATLAGGMSPGHPRFTQSAIWRLRAFRTTGFHVKHQDFRNALAANPEGRLMYLDPPYMIESNNLYGYKGDMHADFDHFSLVDILKSKTNWILSYNDCDAIREMYSDYEMVKPSWLYGMSNNKQSRELLIVNVD